MVDGAEVFIPNGDVWLARIEGLFGVVRGVCWDWRVDDWPNMLPGWTWVDCCTVPNDGEDVIRPGACIMLLPASGLIELLMPVNPTPAKP